MNWYEFIPLISYHINALYNSDKTSNTLYLQGYFHVNYFPTPLKNVSKFYSCKLPDKPQVNYTQLLYWITATDSIMDTQRKTNITCFSVFII